MPVVGGRAGGPVGWRCRGTFGLRLGSLRRRLGGGQGRAAFADMGVQGLGQQDAACQMWAEVEARYPGTPEVAEAQAARRAAACP